MKPARAKSKLAFTLVEMIAVLAIMAIIAGTVAPNAIRALDRAAVRAEADKLHSFGEALKLYVCDYTTYNNTTKVVINMPTGNNWDAQLAPYVSASPTDLLYNSRQATAAANALPRRFAYDATNDRAMFISSMRTLDPNGRPSLPTSATITTNFAAIWNWDSTNTAVTNLPPACLADWTPSLREFLVIERVSLRSAVPLISITFRNQGSASVTYKVYNTAGNQIGATVTVPIGTGSNPLQEYYRAGQRIVLCNAVGAINYTFVVCNQPKAFKFDGTNWLPE